MKIGEAIVSEDAQVIAMPHHLARRSISERILCGWQVALAILASLTVPVLASPDDGKVALICASPLDRKDPDPVIRIYINATFEKSGVISHMSILFQTYSNKYYDRSKQYNSEGINQVPDTAEWQWIGTAVTNKKHVLLGRLFHNHTGWHYVEHHGNTSKSMGPFRTVVSDCFEDEND
jgi:hypothetical protein